MPPATITYLLISLIIGGGMLIPANIPNIISAQRLGITSKEWARIGMPLGIIIMAAFFVLLLLTVKTS
jgi:predicted cation transporter